MNKNVCELFAGVGGFHLGLSRCNCDWNVIWANQFEPSKKKQDAFECYIKNFPNTIAINEDISKINLNPDIYDIPNHSLLVGGFPCQDYSVARTSAEGIEGKKGVLWWEIHKIIKRKKPPFILLENVDRLLKSPAKQRGRDFGIMLCGLKDLGYIVEWRIINAADYGFPQRRKRVFIFAYHNSTNHHNKVLNILNDNNNNKEKYNKFFNEKSFFSEEFKIKEILKYNETNFSSDIIDISENFSFEFLESGILLNDKIISAKIIPESIDFISLKEILEKEVDEKYYLKDEDLEKWKYLKGGKCKLRKSSNGHEYVYREGALSFPDKLESPARTILTSESSKNRSSHVVADLQTNKLRVLTPIEVERLNCFDDNWTNTGMSEKFRYFCMGNALVVGLVTKMGKTLNKIIEKENKA